MKHLLVAAAFLAATCQQPSSPAPTPSPVPEPTATTDPTPEPVPTDTCQALYEHLADLECPPAESGAAWATRCAALTSTALSCALATDTCVVARTCLEK